MAESDQREKYVLIVDPVNGCNLRCPSCPVGNSGLKKRRSNFLPPDKFEHILQKLKGEIRCARLVVWLYNWAEPLLHPDIGELITISRRYCDWVGLSTNLNIRKHDRIERALMAAPHGFKISLSGFEEETYRRSHAGGDMDLVKENLVLVGDILRKSQPDIRRVWVGYHVYRDNAGRELHDMEGFAKRCGIDFEAYPAYLSPLEKVVDFFEGRATAEFLDAERSLLIGLREYAAMVKLYAPGRPSCTWRDDMLTLDVDGNVDLCCRCYDQPLGVNFLDVSLLDIQAHKAGHPFCSRCQAVGWHEAPEIAAHPRMREKIEEMRSCLLA